MAAWDAWLHASELDELSLDPAAVAVIERPRRRPNARTFTIVFIGLWLYEMFWPDVAQEPAEFPPTDH